MDHSVRVQIRADSRKYEIVAAVKNRNFHNRQEQGLYGAAEPEQTGARKTAEQDKSERRNEETSDKLVADCRKNGKRNGWWEVLVELPRI